MGPPIILDKSTFQGLAADGEMVFLRKYFLLNTPPVLLNEIRADLGKKKTRGSPEEVVQTLSRKLSQLDSVVCPDFGEMLRVDLLGGKIPMNAQIPIRGREERGTNDSQYVVANECSQEGDYLRWQTQRYRASEYDEADAWRSSIPIDALEKSRTSTKVMKPGLMEYRSVQELLQHVEGLLNVSGCERDILDLAVTWARFEQDGVDFIMNRWEVSGRPPLREFAPYAYFCAKVLFLHKTGLVREFFTTRSKDLFDLQYVFYLPFCSVFSSSDNFLKAIVPPLLREDQVFVDGTELKADLKKLVDTRDQLDQENRAKWLQEHDDWPPADSLVNRIRTQLGFARDPDKELPRSFTMEDLKQEGAVWRKRTVSLNGPCFCTSGKALKDCCWPKRSQ